jgi:hypothetical protein
MRRLGFAVGLVVLGVAGCGGGSTHATTVSLLGGSGNLNAVACGKQEPFEAYAAPATVRYTGTVSPAPSGRWKVKVKLKVCQGGTFVDSTSQKLVGQPSGRFDGVLAVPQAGSYAVEAHYEGGGTAPESQKVYLQVK